MYVVYYHPRRVRVGAKVMKNWLPLVLGPAFAIDKIPAPVCFNSGFISSSNLELQGKKFIPYDKMLKQAKYIHCFKIWKLIALEFQNKNETDTEESKLGSVN